MQPPLGPPRVWHPRPWQAPSPRCGPAAPRNWRQDVLHGAQESTAQGQLGPALPQRRGLVWVFSVPP